MALQLRITFTSTGQTKAMRFNQTMSVSETLRDIKDKTGEGGRDHGLMRPADPKTGRTAKWLQLDRTLQFYDIKAGEELLLRKKHRPLKVELADGTIKTMLVDDSLPVQDIVEEVGRKMGLRNPEEFSLRLKASEEPATGKKSKKGTPREGDRWLNPSQALGEQGVPDDAVISLKKKFYVDDANVDRSDPVQLHLIYVQCAEAILAGDHQVTKEEAFQFAALQCQILWGNYQEKKHTKDYFKQDDRLAKVLSKPFRKGKAFEEIIKEWQKLINTNEVNAKYRYVQLCRSLKTYGITYYNAKWKLKGKQKLYPIMVGITRDSIICVDPETKQIKEEHPLTHLKRWAAGPNSFTFDYGDYRDEYMSIQTGEGEAISQLLAGYIDILLKRRKDGGVVVEDDEGEIAQEEQIGVETGHVAISTTTTMFAGGIADGATTSVLGGGGQVPGISPGIGGMLGQVGSLSEGENAVLNLLNDLMSPIPIGSHGSKTPEELRQELAKYNNALASAAGALIKDASSGASRQDLDKHSQPLSFNLAQLIGSAKLAAAAAGGDVSLLDGAKAVSDALKKLMNAAGNYADDPSAQNRALLVEAAALLQATSAALNATAVGHLADDPSKNLLLESAKAVAAATRELLNSSLAATANADPGTKAKAAEGAYKVEWGNRKVDTTTTAVAPVISDAGCQKYVVDAAKVLSDACNFLLSSTVGGIKDENSRNDLNRAAKMVNEALMQLINSTQCVSSKADANRELLAAAAFEIQDAVAKVMSSAGNASLIVAASVAVRDASTALVQAAKAVSNDATDANEKQRLFKAMMALTNATKAMLTSATVSAKDPTNDDLHKALREDAVKVGEATKEILGDITTKDAALAALRTAAKATAAATSGLIADSKGVAREVDEATGRNLSEAAIVAASVIAALVGSVKDSTQNPRDASVQSQLLSSVNSAAKPSAGLVATVRASIPQVKDATQKKSLNAAAGAVSEALRKMLDALKAVKEADGHMEVDEALEDFNAAQADLEYALISAKEGTLEPVFGQTREGAMELLALSTRALEQAKSELVESAVISPQAMGPPAKRTTGAVGQVFGAAKAVASTTDSRPAQTKILLAAKSVATETERLINAGRAVSVNPADEGLNSNMNAADSAVQAAIELLLAAANNAGAGSEECDQAGDQIQKGAKELLTGFGSSSGDLQDFADELASCCKALEAAITQVVDSARNNPKGLGPAANLTASTMPPILKATNNAAAKSPDPVVGEQILVAGKSLADDTRNLLRVAKSVTASPDDHSAAQSLATTAKDVRDDIKELLKAVDAAIPGKKDLIEAQDIIFGATNRLTQPSVGSENPQIHLREIQEAAKVLADSVGRIVASARNFPEKLGPYSKQAAEAVSDIVDASKDAASVDPAAVLQLSANKLSKDSKKTLEDPDDVALVLDSAKDVARDASELVSNVKKAAGKEADKKARQDLIHAAEACANATSELAVAAKAVAKHEPGADKKLAAAGASLESKIRAILAYNKTGGGANYRPLLDAAKLVADETSKMLDVLKIVSGKPKDGAAQTQLSVSAKATIDGIKQLIQAAEELTFGHKECKEAIEAIQRAIGDLDATAINATVGLLTQSIGGPTNQQCKEELIALSRDLAGVTGKLVTAAKNHPEELGPAALETTVVVPKIVESSKRLAATTTDPETQQEQLMLAKNMTDTMLALVLSARETSSNPFDQETLNKLANSAKDVSSAITELVSKLRGGVLGLRACDEALAAIEGSKAALGKTGAKKQYGQAGDELTKQARELVGVISRMATVAKNDPEKVGDASKAVAEAIPKLVDAINTTAASSNEEDVKRKLLHAGGGVLATTKDSVSASKNVAADPKNQEAISALSQQQRAVTQAIGDLLTAIREGATLERDTDLAVAKIHTTMADLDAASLFAAATAGQMDVQLASGQTLDTCQSSLTKDSKQLLAAINNVQKTTSSGQGGQEALGKAFKDLAAQMDVVGKDTKEVASLMGDLLSQQDVMTAAKASCIASQSLILAAKEVAVHPEDPAAQKRLQDSHAASSASVSDLINVSEKASAEAVKGIRELEKAEKEINAQFNNFNSGSWAGNKSATAEAVVKAARVLAAGSGNVVSTCTNDKEGLVKAAQACSQGAVALLGDSKGAGELTDDPKVKADLLRAVNNTTQATLELLGAAKSARDTPDSQKNMSSLSEKVADRIMEVVGAARRLPGGAGLRLEEDTGDDLEAIAEKELMKAAKMIEDAAKRLLAARPKKVKTSDKLDEQDITAAILDAARAITVATGSLVQCATVAQRERIAKSRDPAKKHFYRKDPAWANGLISAAQAVGGTTQDLVSAANGFVKKEKEFDEEMLIASAKQVAAATARLMAASRAKSDPFSDSHKNLAEASKAVAAATQALVDAARMAGQALAEPEVIETSIDDISAVQARKEQLKAQAEMLRLEKELEKARNAYSNLHKEKYSDTKEGGSSPAAAPSPRRPSAPPKPAPGRPGPGNK